MNGATREGAAAAAYMFPASRAGRRGSRFGTARSSFWRSSSPSAWRSRMTMAFPRTWALQIGLLGARFLSVFKGKT